MVAPLHVTAHLVSPGDVAACGAFPATGCWGPGEVGAPGEVDAPDEVGAPGEVGAPEKVGAPDEFGAPAQDDAPGAVEEGNDKTCTCPVCDRYTGGRFYNQVVCTFKKSFLDAVPL